MVVSCAPYDETGRLHSVVVAADLLGRVLVVVGDAPALHDLTAQCVASGAMVAVVSTRRPAVEVGLDFRADPGDSVALQRIAAHVEQRLGPIDAVVCDPPARAAVVAVFEPDLQRRGHGRVVVSAGADDAATLLSRLVGTP